eukprot:scaffold2325_cov30-Tisochrysis_lutea.AAC.2
MIKAPIKDLNSPVGVTHALLWQQGLPDHSDRGGLARIVTPSSKSTRTEYLAEAFVELTDRGKEYAAPLIDQSLQPPRQRAQILTVES